MLETISSRLFFKISSAKHCVFKLGSYNCVRNLISVIRDEKTGTAQLILQKPPVNTMNSEMFQKLTSAIKDLEEKKFRGLIISSGLPRVFCAGLDITEFYKPSEEKLRTVLKAFQTFWKTLYSTPLVTIAAVNGHARGGGCVLLLSCDHSIVVNSDFRLGLSETLLGFAPPKWVSLLLFNACKTNVAEHAIKKSRLFRPKEAVDVGIADELIEFHSGLIPEAEKALNHFLTIPGSAFQTLKSNFRKPLVDKPISYQEQDVDELIEIVFRDETQNVIGKYIENLKRK